MTSKRKIIWGQIFPPNWPEKSAKTGLVALSSWLSAQGPADRQRDQQAAARVRQPVPPPPELSPSSQPQGTHVVLT